MKDWQYKKLEEISDIAERNTPRKCKGDEDWLKVSCMVSTIINGSEPKESKLRSKIGDIHHYINQIHEEWDDGLIDSEECLGLMKEVMVGNVDEVLEKMKKRK